jgi:twitching motility protein PilT
VPQMYSAIQTGQGLGMQTLDQCMVELVRQGIITKQDAQMRAVNKDSFL